MAKLTYEELSKGKINHLQHLHTAKFWDSYKQDEDEKIKYQNIRYYRNNGIDEVIESENSVLIDYFKAKNEIVSAANYNSPGQVVISGHKIAVKRVIDMAKKIGAKRGGQGVFFRFC